MTNSNFLSRIKDKDALISILFATILTLYLFYLDEGYYNFKWMLNWGNWIPFVIYTAIIFIVYWLLTKFIGKFISSRIKYGLSAFILIALAFGLIFMFP